MFRACRIRCSRVQSPEYESGIPIISSISAEEQAKEPESTFRNQGYLIGVLMMRESCYLGVYIRGPFIPCPSFTNFSIIGGLRN